MTLRILTYNIEWGFLNLPDDVEYDACGHKLPHTKEAQEEHLTLAAKNIGLAVPNVCFLQEIGSLDAMKYIRDKINEIYGIRYNIGYSRNEEKGQQGIGILIAGYIKYNLVNLPDFGYKRAFGIKIKSNFSSKINNYNKNSYDIHIIGVHSKSLYGDNKSRNIAIQEHEADVINKYFENSINGKNNPAVIFCGDFNNTVDSPPIQKIVKFRTNNNERLIDLMDSEYYIPNITNSKETQFSKNFSTRIDYIWCNESFAMTSCKSIQIIELKRLNYSGKELNLRLENSDHLPVLGVFDV
tara:strand:- start:922 stop:1812 length:891 start_codon:yes stop_codon:yes gene_type:complete